MNQKSDHNPHELQIKSDILKRLKAIPRFDLKYNINTNRDIGKAIYSTKKYNEYGAYISSTQITKIIIELEMELEKLS